MEKRVIWCSMLVFLLSFMLPVAVQATVSFDPLARATVNVGDSLTVSGGVLLQQNLRGKLTLQFVCGDQKTDILVRAVSFQANERVSFQELFTFPAQVGDCRFQVAVNDGGQVVDSGQSTILQVSDLLKGNVTLDSATIQLGQVTAVRGQLTTVAGELVNGLAVTSLKKGGETFLVGRVPVTRGEFRTVVGPLFLPTALYDVDVAVRDTFGNRYTASLPLQIVGDIIVDAQLERQSLVAGDALQLAGNISYRQAPVAGNATATLLFDGRNISLGPLPSFSAQMVLEDNMSRGSYPLTVHATDAYGNEGGSTLNVTIISRPSVIQNIVSPLELLPGKEVSLRGMVMNNYEEKMERIVALSVLDSGRVVWEGQAQSGVAVPYLVANFTPPGEFVFRSRYALTSGELTLKERESDEKKELVNETSFKILELREIDSRLEGSRVFIKNVGNVRYAELINLTLIGGKDYVINKFIDLQPAEEVAFDIGGEVPSDNYTVILPFESATVPNVTVGDTAMKEELQEGLIHVEERLGWVRKAFFIGLVVIFLVVSWWTIFRHHQTTKQQREKEAASWQFESSEERRKKYYQKAFQESEKKSALRRKEMGESFVPPKK